MRQTGKHRQAHRHEFAQELLDMWQKEYDDTYREYRPSGPPPPPPLRRNPISISPVHDIRDLVAGDARRKARADKVADLKAVCESGVDLKVEADTIRRLWEAKQ